MKSKYRTVPVPSTAMPAGIPFIVGNEAAERFSFYGMKAILFVFMTEYLLSSGGSGSRDVMSNEEAKEYVHWFVASAYFFPVVGAIISDAFLGKYRTILYLSVVYCLGHLALAMNHTRLWLVIGLTLIAIGTGAIKPCVSAHVGDQFGQLNKHLLPRVFAWFYFSINLGAAASTWLTPRLLADRRWGADWAFGVPGILMGLATVVFWLGRHRFIHVPPSGMRSVKQAFSGEGLRAIINLALIYACVLVFWSLFDQTGSAWIQQAKRMDLTWLGVKWLPSQIQAANPLLVMAFIPLFSYVVYPAISRVFPLTPLRKLAIGFFLTVPAFALPAWIDSQITGGEVVFATSEGNAAEWSAQNLFDGRDDGSGWVSAELGPLGFPQEIVIRLRERRDWSISSVRVNPYASLSQLLASGSGSGAADAVDSAAVESCWAKGVEVFVGETRLGDPVLDAAGLPLLDEKGQPKWEWTRRMGALELPQRDDFFSLEFPAVTAQYVLIRITSNWGGPMVALGEIQILSPDSLPADAHRHAAAVWPNVAATGYQPNISWQLIAYVLMTAAEIMVSITCLEFSYTQAPNTLKSFIMSLFLLSVSLGNVFTALVNKYIANPDGSSKLEGPDYYWFFTGVMALTAVLFLGISKIYRGRTYIQDEDSGVQE